MDNKPLILFYVISAILLCAAGLALLLAPAASLQAFHPGLGVSAGEVLLARQAGAGLLLAGLINISAAVLPAPRKMLHRLTVVYLVIFMASHGAQQALWWLWLAVLAYALPLLSLARLPLGRLSLPAADSQRRGQIKWFNARKGFGFIVTEEGEEIFVHFRALRNGGRQSLKPGTRVRFQVRKTARGDQADPVFVDD